MTLEELEATEWAKEFKADSPLSYPEALACAMRKGLNVCIRQSDEAGEPLWVIVPDEEDIQADFWMDAKPTKKEAVALCRRMGWRVTP